MDKETAKQIADTICEQMGGYGRLRLMLGTKTHFYSSATGSYSFDFKMCRKASLCEITLDPLDTYTMRFVKLKRAKTEYGFYTTEPVEAAKFEGVYCDQLRDVFERYTGLTLAIPRIVGVNA